MTQRIVTTRRPAYQAYQILYIGFIVAPLLAGLDKFAALALARLSEEFAEPPFRARRPVGD
jgi:hypothetical protein